MLYISTKFHDIILNSIKVIEQTRFLYRKLQRGIIPQKMYRNNSIYWDPVCIGTPFVLEKIIIQTIILIGTY